MLLQMQTFDYAAFYDNDFDGESICRSRDVLHGAIVVVQSIVVWLPRPKSTAWAAIALGRW